MSVHCFVSFFTCIFHTPKGSLIIILSFNLVITISHNAETYTYSRPWLNTYVLHCAISRGQDVIPWDLLAEIDFFVLSYSLTLP